MKILENILDTAMWVAIYRAMESDRPDAHFRDPYARRLAGKRGQLIYDRLPGARYATNSLVVRTCLFDELIRECICSRGVRTVVNLAAGLDTRPYRMTDLPCDLDWVEVDLPALLKYKERVLETVEPRCRVERVALDLTQPEPRRALFGRLSGPTLVVVEGLLTYLRPDDVAGLTDDIRSAGLGWLAMDYTVPSAARYMERYWADHLKAADAEWHFTQGPEFLTRRGWRIQENCSFLREAQRLNRVVPSIWLLAQLARFAPRVGNLGGVCLLRNDSK